MHFHIAAVSNLADVIDITMGLSQGSLTLSVDVIIQPFYDTIQLHRRIQK
jgi:hypothetical protein